VYKVLAEAPDPYPLLDLAVDQTVKISQIASLESEVSRLRQENSSLLSKIEGQGSNDRERRKAEKKVELLEEKMEDLVKERVSAKENELKAIYEERLLNYEERYVPMLSVTQSQLYLPFAREKDLQRQVTTTKMQLRELRNANDSKEAQLLDHSQRQGWCPNFIKISKY
jgi:homeobox protein cut-like